MKTYQPKGGMCATCKHKLKDCSAFNFSEMPKLKAISDNVIIVRCISFDREVNNELVKPLGTWI
jgi:hypothetical protein